MKKTIYSVLSSIIIMLLASCSSSPWVGEWYPSNDINGNSYMEINSDGTVDMVTDAEDGAAIISGTWTESGNEISVILDSNTIELVFDNPIAEEIVRQALYAIADETTEFILSDDGKRLINKSDRQKSFVKK